MISCVAVRSLSNCSSSCPRFCVLSSPGFSVIVVSGPRFSLSSLKERAFRCCGDEGSELRVCKERPRVWAESRKERMARARCWAGVGVASPLGVSASSLAELSMLAGASAVLGESEFRSRVLRDGSAGCEEARRAPVAQMMLPV